MVEYTAMTGIHRKNWLLIITAVLFLVSVGIVVYKFYLESKSSFCHFNGTQVRVGQKFSDIENGDDCVCTQEGKVVCTKGEDTDVSKDLKTDNLKFEYKYVNSLEGEVSNDQRVIPVDINQKDDEVEVIIEREGMCSEELKAPNQIGYYEISENSLTLSTITGDEPSLYTVVCVMSNTYRISNLPVTTKDGYKVYYKNEKGKLFDLGACVYDGVLYGRGDVFSSPVEKKICTCESSKVSCD